MCLRKRPRIAMARDDIFYEWFEEFWESELIITDIGFFAIKDEGDNAHLMHFFLRPENRGIKNFRKLTEQVFKFARDEDYTKVVAEVDIGTPRWKQILWADVKWGGFKVVGETATEVLLEYEL